MPRFTIKHYRMLPEGFPAQLVNGCLVADDRRTFCHQYLAQTLALRLDTIVGRARVVLGPLGVVVDEHNVYHPDVIVLRETPQLTDREVPPPLLAIEVLSPSTARRDRNIKRKRLIAAGTVEVWLVDPDAQTVEVHDATGCRIGKDEQELTSRAMPGFSVVPARLFQPPLE